MKCFLEGFLFLMFVLAAIMGSAFLVFTLMYGTLTEASLGTWVPDSRYQTEYRENLRNPFPLYN